MTLQQVTGQPSILYYASSIFDDAGMAAYAAVLTGSFKLVMTLLSVVVDLGGSARATSWLELLQRTNEVMASDYDGLPSMEICSTCRGAPFSPEELTLGEAS